MHGPLHHRCASYHDDHACPMNMTISGRAVIGTGLGISHICCCTGLKGLYTPLGPLKVHHSCPYFAEDSICEGWLSLSNGTLEVSF